MQRAGHKIRRSTVCDLLEELVPLPNPQVPYSYHVKEEVRSIIKQNCYRRLLQCFPTLATAILGDCDRSVDDALQLIAAHGWSLSTTQLEEARRLAHSRKKGKQAQRAQSPWLSADHNDGLDDAELLGPEYSEERRGTPCGHIFQKGEAIYRCRDCGLDDTCVQCAPCFQASIHVRNDHDIVFSVSPTGGGCCDCGDEEAWTKEVGCRYHGPIAYPSGSKDMDLGPDSLPADTSSTAMDDGEDRRADLGESLSHVPESVVQNLSAMLVELVSLIVTVLEHSPDEIALPKASEALEIVSNLPSLDEGRYLASGSASATRSQSSLDNDGLESDEEMSMVEVEDLVGNSNNNNFTDRRDASPFEKDSFEAAPRFHTRYSHSISADDGSNYPHGAKNMPHGAVGGESGLEFEDAKRMYAVILWNDEKHSFSQVIDIVTDATGGSEQDAKEVADRVDTHGRDIIDMSTDLRSLHQIARTLNSIDLAVTLRPAFDVFAEEVTQVVLSFLIDLSNCVLYLPDPAEAVASKQHLKADASVLKELIAQSLFAPFQPFQPISAGSMSPDYFDPANLSFFDGLVLMDYKFWKSARIDVKALFMSLIAHRETKKQIAFRFAKVYPKLVETFMLKDREQEYSICLFTVQLFSVPSIATLLVGKFHFLDKLVKLLQSMFTGQTAHESLSLVLPPPASPNGQANVHLMFLRQARSYHIFYDLRYLLAAEGVQKIIADRPNEHLSYFLPCLALFQGINPSKRAVSTHVEFESEAWIPVFHISSHLGKAVKMLGEAFAYSQPADLSSAMSCVAHHILTVNNRAEGSGTYPNLDLHEVDIALPREEGVDRHQVLEFAVDSQPISFHHPLHWLLAEVIKQIPAIGDPAIRARLGINRLAELCHRLGDVEWLYIFDFPLRVCVKLAQIRCNLWVRNGFVIRSQAHHYRDNSMRGIMYDQDIFLVQVALAVVNTDRFLLTMLDRFSLIDWFRNKCESTQSPYDPGQSVFMAEEFLFLLTTCLAELSSVCAWSMEKQVRREIVHFLALGQGTFTDVTKSIPEKFTDHVSFERMLGQVSDFRAPDGTHDFGIFELKDECYDEVQPFFFHYTRNQREKVEEVLRLRQKKKLAKLAGKTLASVRDEDLLPIVPPRQLHNLRGSLFGQLPEILLNRKLLFIIFWALDNTRVLFSYAPDLLVDAALQIIMIALVETGAEFAFIAGDTSIDTLVAGSDDDDRSPPIINGTLLQLLCRIELMDKFKPYRSKVTWCLNTIGTLTAHPDITAHFAATGRSGLGATHGQSQKSKQQVAEESRRAAAKARQAAIMQKFSAQQKSLLDQFEAEEDDDDDEIEVDGDTKSMTDHKTSKRVWGSCILCQENLGSDKAFGSLAHIQPSRMMRMTPTQDGPSLQQALETPLTLDRNREDGKRVQGTPPSGRSASLNANIANGKGRSGPAYGSFSQSDHRFGFHASACGHLMHLHCFETYCRSVEQRHTQQIARNHPEDLHRSEFICPLCKSLGNVILPVADATGVTLGSEMNDTAVDVLQSTLADETSLQDWIRKINIDILKHSSKNKKGDYQEREHGSGAFTPYFVEHALSKRGLEEANIDRSTAHMLDRLRSVLQSLSVSTRDLRKSYQDRTVLAPQSLNLYMPGELMAYTIAALEIAQRGTTPSPSTDCKTPLDQRSIADSLSDSNVDLLRSLIQCLRLLTPAPRGAEGPGIIRRGLLKRLLPHWGGDEAVRSPLLLRDPLTILVEAAVVAPESLAQCTVLMYYVCLIQTVFGLAQPSIWPQSSEHSGPAFANTAGTRTGGGLRVDQVSEHDVAEARRIFPDVRWTVANVIGFVGYARGNITLGFDNLDDDTLAKMLCSYTLPFLRRAAILRRVAGYPTQTAPPASFEDGSTPREYSRLLAQLDIPAPAVALPIRAEKQTPIASLVEGWIKHAYVPLASLFRPLPISSALLGPSLFEKHPTLLLEHPHIYELARLPTDLAVLLQDTRKRVCHRCRNVPPEPALCLLCGDVVCFQSFCCQKEDRGECNEHTLSCGGAIGVFFKIKSNIVMLLYEGNGTFNFLSPYLDSHGEIDVGLRKGRPQKLHQQRYDELRKQVWAHGTANIVARKIEAAMDQGGWQTF